MCNITPIGEEHVYQAFERSLQGTFDQRVAHGVPLFKVAVAQDLWELYIQNIEPLRRQAYNCSRCKNFIRNYGDLVVIHEDGSIRSALWQSSSAPAYFKAAVTHLQNWVEASPIKTVFATDQRELGEAQSGGWPHLSLKLPQGLVTKSVIQTASQLMATKREEFRLLTDALTVYSLPTIKTVQAIINSETIYRGDRFKGMVTWFLETKAAVSKAGQQERIHNVTWLAVARAQTGFCHIKNSMVGTLLDDVQSDLPHDEVVMRFDQKMNPNNYRRSQAAPTAGAIVEAEAIIAKLGMAESLERRYARIEEIPEFIWQGSKDSPKTGIFAKVLPKRKSLKGSQLPMTTMTWQKFAQTVLPTATYLEARVDNPNRLMALVTENKPASEPIFQWDNPFSWYYHGGVDGEIKRRVETAGGRYENNDLRCSLLWDNRTDLDLHCITPTGKHLFYGNKTETNGWLDVDMNVKGETLAPVENIRWAKNQAVNGRYQFYVQNYRDRSAGQGTPYKVELEVAGELFTYHGHLEQTNMKELVFDFTYHAGQVPKLVRQSALIEGWHVNQGAFAKVTAITTSPNLWGANPLSRGGNHTFFLLEGCRDSSEGKGRGFFNEMLKPELYEIRKTLEAYSAMTPIKEASSGTASGLGFSKESQWELVLNVTTEGLRRRIKIDRFD